MRFWPRLWQRPLRLPAAGRCDAPLRGRPGATHAQPGAAQGGAARGQVLEGLMTMGRASARCGTRKSARWTDNLRGVEAGRRRGRRPRTPQWGDLELCCWGWRGDMYALMVSKFQLRNYRPPGVGGAFAICGLEKKLAAVARKKSQLSRGRCGGPPHFLAGFLGSAGPGTPQRAPNRRESPGGGAGGLG